MSAQPPPENPVTEFVDREIDSAKDHVDKFRESLAGRISAVGDTHLRALLFDIVFGPDPHPLNPGNQPPPADTKPAP